MAIFRNNKATKYILYSSVYTGIYCKIMYLHLNISLYILHMMNVRFSLDLVRLDFNAYTV